MSHALITLDPQSFTKARKVGWKCCKPRVLTFDEFMAIPPCTTGKHSTVDDTPAAEPKPTSSEVDARIKAQQAKQQENLSPPIARNPVATQAARPTPSPAPPEDDDDDPDAPIPTGATCKRRACGATYDPAQPRSEEQCQHHPGVALFHEGSKGWTCCKRRVLEFDEFMKIAGCKQKERHLFVGSAKHKAGAEQEEEQLESVRNDFYQTATTVIASLYLKKIERERSRVEFTAGPEGGSVIELDLHTSDRKGYRSSMRLFGPIDAEKSAFKIMGTKLELTLVKADGVGWPVLRADDPHTGEIIQAGCGAVGDYGRALRTV
nr:cysteine and histidine-rich domain-containing protein 1 [Quercus suber]